VTTPGAGGGPSPLRLGGLGLIGVAVVAAIIGLASMATSGNPATTVAPSADASSVTTAPGTVPSPAPPPALPPAEPVPTDGGSVPVPSFVEPAPGEPAPGAVPPGEAAPAPGAPGAEVPPAEPAPQAAPAPGAPAPAPGAAPAPQPAPDSPGAAAPVPQAGGGEPGVAAPAPSGGGNGGARTGDTTGGDTRTGRSGGGGASVAHLPLRVYNNSTIGGLATRAAEDFRKAGWPIDEVGNYPQGVIPTTTVYYRPGTEEEAPAKALAEQFGMRANPRFDGLQHATPGIIVIVTNDYGR
jgi:hypothetical protein